MESSQGDEQVIRNSIFDTGLILAVMIRSQNLTDIGRAGWRRLPLFHAFGNGGISREFGSGLVNEAYRWAIFAIERIRTCDSAGRVPTLRMDKRRAEYTLKRQLIVEMDRVGGND